ncbi:hypothetical protein M3I53_30830 [Paraburkholderia sp. CNPSo 3272]|uniref:hypothetical protein n=1 Tax=Paraburkholderia sp. CNPSo 3272 TaxID=2940931 RepID=UPI0020B757C9|nr:hypothetical protein [Paraburkholderia sp. CNPSo 3272]MCP3727467.1 hypothetical protein [Paraburkholderia sp. CNPSo 3272]
MSENYLATSVCHGDRHVFDRSASGRGWRFVADSVVTGAEYNRFPSQDIRCFAGDDGSGQRGRKRDINSTANARSVLRLHAYAASNQFPAGQAKRLRFGRSSGESIDVARRTPQDIVFCTKLLFTLKQHGAHVPDAHRFVKD